MENIRELIFISTISTFCSFRNDILGGADVNVEIFSELLTINLIKLEKVSSSLSVKSWALLLKSVQVRWHPSIAGGGKLENRADELKVSREQSVTRHASLLMIYSHWSAGWGSSGVTCKRSSSLIRHVQKHSRSRLTITSSKLFLRYWNPNYNAIFVC